MKARQRRAGAGTVFESFKDLSNGHIAGQPVVRRRDVLAIEAIAR